MKLKTRVSVRSRASVNNLINMLLFFDFHLVHMYEFSLSWEVIKSKLLLVCYSFRRCGVVAFATVSAFASATSVDDCCDDIQISSKIWSQLTHNKFKHAHTQWTCTYIVYTRCISASAIIIFNVYNVCVAFIWIFFHSNNLDMKQKAKRFNVQQSFVLKRCVCVPHIESKFDVKTKAV